MEEFLWITHMSLLRNYRINKKSKRKIKNVKRKVIKVKSYQLSITEWTCTYIANQKETASIKHRDCFFYSGPNKVVLFRITFPFNYFTSWAPVTLPSITAD